MLSKAAKLHGAVAHVCMSPTDEVGCLVWALHVPKKLLFGEVKGRCPVGCPRSSINAVAVRDCQLRRIPKPYKDAQNRLLWRDKTCLART